MLENQKHVFWQALLIAIFIFASGIALGFWLEESRIGKIAGLYAESELDLLDVKIQADILDLGEVNCKTAEINNLEFADKVYEEAKLLSKYDGSARLSDGIKLQHKKYDLLRTILWMNSIKIKKLCNSSFSNVVYIYQYNNPSIETSAEQGVVSRFLGDLKNKYGASIMLIPFAGDNNSTSITSLMRYYGVETLPSVIVDERLVIDSIEELDRIESYLNSRK